MKCRLIVRAFTMAVAAGALSLGTGMIPAQAARVAPDNSAPKCDDGHALCIWQHNNFTGPAAVLPTGDFTAQPWYYIPDHGITIPWGSFYDNSGSSVVFGDASTGQTKCYDKGDDPDGVANPSVIYYGYFHIEYGIPNCSGTVPKLP